MESFGDVASGMLRNTVSTLARVLHSEGQARDAGRLEGRVARLSPAGCEKFEQEGRIRIFSLWVWILSESIAENGCTKNCAHIDQLPLTQKMLLLDLSGFQQCWPYPQNAFETILKIGGVHNVTPEADIYHHGDIHSRLDPVHGPLAFLSSG